MNISYDHYKIFYNVAKYKSFSRAAEATLCNQPNLTRAVKTLEKELGCTLFERTSKGVILTDDGKALFEHISVAFEHIQAGEEAVRTKHSMEHGIVSIGATEIALHNCLLPILSIFHNQYPGIRIKILNISTPQALKMTENKLVDFAIVTSPVEKNQKLAYTSLSKIQEVPICSPNFKIKDKITFKELLEYPVISLCSSTSTHQFYLEKAHAYGSDFAPDIEAATADQIIPLVKHGLGIGFVPKEFLLSETDIKQISLKEPTFEREILLVRKAKHNLSLPAKKLFELIKTNYGY